MKGKENHEKLTTRKDYGKNHCENISEEKRVQKKFTMEIFLKKERKRKESMFKLFGKTKIENKFAHNPRKQKWTL